MILLQVGDIVKLKDGADKGHYAFIYETFNRNDIQDPHGVSIMTDKGKDLGGWSGSEQEGFMQYIGTSGVSYSFQNALRLYQDKGIIVNAIEKFLKAKGYKK